MNHFRISSRCVTYAWLFASLASTGCARGYSVEASGPDAGDGPPPPIAVPASIQTVVSPTTVQAGAYVNVECHVFDADGERILDLHGSTPKVVHEPRYLFDGNAEGLLATTVGTGNVACTLASHGLFDGGVEVTIVPGPAHTVITKLADDQVVAGASATATCHVYDAFGNAVEGAEASLFVSPSGDGVEIQGLEASITRSGTYEVTCAVSGGAAHVESDFLRVDPALPYSMTVGLRPERVPFRINDQTLLEPDVRDRFGNRVTGAVIEYSATGGVTSQSGARFTFVSDGASTLRARVTSPIDPEVIEVAASASVIVNTTGPDIECLRIDNYEPSPAYMTHRAAGASVQVRARISDAFDIAQVRIAGSSATEVSRGVYQANHTVRWGVNFVDVVATDAHGLENSRTCFFLASDRWTGESAFMAGSVGFRMNQSAVGPGTPGQLTSLNEILRVILNSPALRTMVDQGLPGTLNSGGCGVFACNPDVHYNRGSLSWGAVSSALTLTDGGLSAQITIPNVRLSVRACGTTCCIGGSTITATASSVSATVNFSLALQNGVLRAGVVGTPSVTVGGVSLSGSGFCGFLVNLIQGFFENTLRNAIRDALQGFIGSEVGPLLDDLVSSLDVSSLGSSFVVPRLDGTGNISLGFGMELSSLGIAANNRLLLGIGTRFTPAANAHNRPSLGVARRTDAILLDPPITAPRTIGISFYEGALNQVLHALWRGGLFQANLDLGGGARVGIDALIPPVVHIEGSGARLMLGGVRATVRIPPLIDEPPFEVMFGGVATATVTLAGDSLSFGGININVNDDLYVSFDDAVSDQARAVLTSALGSVLQSVLFDAVNDGLPAIPIPSFTLPPEVSQFGLPANAQLGITSPQLTTQANHFRLQGGFGVQ